MTRENSLKVDFLKFVGALLVVDIHCGWPEGAVWSLTWWVNQLFVDAGVPRIAVPFFFAFSGYFLARHLDSTTAWRTAVRKRIRTLVVPFFLWSGIATVLVPLVLGFVSDAIGHRPFGTTSLDFCRNADWLRIFGLSVEKPNLYPFWFIRNLFLLVLTAPLIVSLVRRFGHLYLVLCFLVYLCSPLFLTEGEFACHLFADFYSFPGLFYFSCGVYLWENGLPHLPGGGGGYLLLGFALFVVRAICLTQGAVRLGNMIQIAALPVFMFAVWRLTPARPLPQPLRQLSLPILALQTTVFLVVNLAWKAIPSIADLLRTQSVVRLVAGIAGSILITHLLRRYAPRFTRVAFGER